MTLAQDGAQSPDGHRLELAALGAALLGHSESILGLTAAPERGPDAVNAGDGGQIGDGLSELFELSTRALARRLGATDASSDPELEGEMARLLDRVVVQPGRPLGEATRSFMRWRDATCEVLNECAQEIACSRDVLIQALALVQVGLDVMLTQLCTVFDENRRRIEEQLARRQQELAYTASHDALTGLPNRSLMLDRGAQMLVRARRHRTPVAALSIDLDDFKCINDTLGRGAGDEILKAMAGRLREVVRESDAVGRVGGDEFLLIVDELTLATGAEVVAERLQAALQEPFSLGDDEQTRLTVTASIGIASGEHVSVEELLRDAEIALDRAKRDDKSSYVVFQPDMHDVVQSRMTLEQDLREATVAQDFFVVYQPTFDLRDMSPIGMEALIRWRHPARGVVAPNDFIPQLEEAGLIADVGRWVLEEACRQGARWRAEGFDIGIAVNVSARQLERDQFVTEVQTALADSRMTPTALTLEITESTLMRDPERTAARLAAIKSLGVRLAIDDFGTGYSSLSHLQQLPVDSLKIDRSFICRVSDNPEGEKLIHTLVQLGKALSIETLAEGIEQQRELSLLRDEQCDSGQGFLFAKPLTVEAASAFLANWRDSQPGQSSPTGNLPGVARSTEAVQAPLTRT